MAKGVHVLVFRALQCLAAWGIPGVLKCGEPCQRQDSQAGKNLSLPTFKSAVVRTEGEVRSSSQEQWCRGNGTSLGLQVAKAGKDFTGLSLVLSEDVAFSFLPLPLQLEWAPEAGDVSTMSLKGETELGGMKREAERDLKGPEVLGDGGSRRRWSMEGKAVGPGDNTGENTGLDLDCQRALGAFGSPAPTGQLPWSLRHTLNICAHWCQLLLAGLEHSCRGLTGQAGLNIDSQGGRTGVGRNHGA